MFWSLPSVVFVFPFCCVLRLFSHELEGADPSSYAAYPRVIEPAPRPSEGPGSAIVRGRLDTAFRDIFFALMCLAEGHRDPGTIFGGEGALSLPPQVPFSHALLSFTRPRFFFFFFGLRGHALLDCSTHEWSRVARLQDEDASQNGISNSDSCPENTPELSEKSRHTRAPPPSSPANFC